MNKKTLFVLMLILGTNLIAKNKENFDWQIQNKHFKQLNPELPIEIKKIESGIKSYTVGILSPTKIQNDYLHFNEKIIVKNKFYAFNTQKKHNELLTENTKANLLKFEKDVFFQNGASLVLRTNIQKNKGDFIDFSNIITEDGRLLVEIKDKSTFPRYVRIPLFMTRKENVVNAMLVKPLILNGVEYVINYQVIEDSNVYYLEPMYHNEEQALYYREYEKEVVDNKGQLEYKNIILLREKITIFNEDDLIYTHNIIDIFDKE